MDHSIIIGLGSSLASIAGLLVGAIQTIRIRRIKREETADIWLTIRILKNLIVHLRKDDLFQNNNNIAQAYEAVLSIFRTQIKRAAMNENNYTTETIEKWKTAKKISSQWEEKQALVYLETKKIKNNSHM